MARHIPNGRSVRAAVNALDAQNALLSFGCLTFPVPLHLGKPGVLVCGAGNHADQLIADSGPASMMATRVLIAAKSHVPTGKPPCTPPPLKTNINMLESSSHQAQVLT